MKHELKSTQNTRGQVALVFRSHTDTWIHCLDQYSDLITRLWAPAGVDIELPFDTDHAYPVLPTFSDVSRETYEALRRSVWKWWGVAWGNKSERGVIDCALCHMYVEGKSILATQCGSCPIKEKTGQYGCAFTPFDGWQSDIYSIEHGFRWRDEFDYERAAQQAAIDFYFWLQALRDEYREQLESVEESEYCEQAYTEHCNHPDHSGCRQCDEDALSLRDREEYEGHDDD
jgi:hypothetical protein